MRLTRFAALIALALIAGPASAADPIPNPEFTGWSKFKPGTSVTLKMVTESAGMTSEVVMTNKLVEVGANKLVIETETITKSFGMEFKTPPMKRDVPKTYEVPVLPNEVAKKDPKADPKAGTKTEEGTETLKIGGVEVKTKWTKYTIEMDGTKFETKAWTSDDVPGTVVKSVATTTGKFTSSTKSEVTEFKKP